jgi:hypothetical protein
VAPEVVVKGFLVTLPVLEAADEVVNDPEVIFDVGPEGDAVELWVTVEAQDTADGRLVTPFVLHKVWAYEVAACWSATLQAPARQHAIWPRKLWFEQMHAISGLLQPAICEPEVNSSTQGLCNEGKEVSILWRKKRMEQCTAQSGRPGNVWAKVKPVSPSAIARIVSLISGYGGQKW